MKKEYPEYVRHDLEKIFRALPQTEQDEIKKFVDYCGIGSGTRKQADIKRSIIQFRDILEKPLSRVTLEDLRTYLLLLNKSTRQKYTKNGNKTHIKRFLKWKFKDWSERFNELNDIKTQQAFNEQRINEGTLLKKEDIEKIMSKEKDFVKKAFFICLFESGLRPQELRTIRWKDVRLNAEGDLSELHIYATKTSKARTVYVKAGSPYLAKLQGMVDSEYVFNSPEDKNEPLPKITAIRWVKVMGKHINKDIFPYLLRHSRATELYGNLPSKVAQKFLGHAKDMSDFYAHLSSKEVKDSMLKTVYHVEELPEEKKTELEKKIDLLEEKLKETDKKLQEAPEKIMKLLLKRFNK